MVRPDGLCLYCRVSRARVWDHFYPRAAGGEHAPANLVPACTPCNNIKQDWIFWNIAAVRDFLRFSKGRSGRYNAWLKVRFRRAVTPRTFDALARVFDAP